MPIVTFVRHGETKMNKADVCQSRTPGELTAKGVKMAEALGDQLQNEKFTHIFTSDLKRCHDTTLNILKHCKHKQPKLVLKPILRERDFGDLELGPDQNVRDICKAHNLLAHMIPVPNGESFEDVTKRCGKFFMELCDLIDSCDIPENEINILVVSHGMWLITFFQYLASNPDSFELQSYDHEKERHTPLRNTGNTKIDVQKFTNVATEEINNRPLKRVLKFHHYNSGKHLENLNFEE